MILIAQWLPMWFVVGCTEDPRLDVYEVSSTIVADSCFGEKGTTDDGFFITFAGLDEAWTIELDVDQGPFPCIGDETTFECTLELPPEAGATPSYTFDGTRDETAIDASLVYEVTCNPDANSCEPCSTTSEVAGVALDSTSP